MDLRTRYLGLTLSSPLVPSASPLSEKVDNIRRMEDAGAGAVVLQSLFEEQIEQESQTLLHYLDLGSESFAESLSYLPAQTHGSKGVEDYLEHVRRAKAAVRIPVIASLNGSTPGWWVKTVAQVQQAGADAIELNLYHVEADPAKSAHDVEERLLSIVREFRSATTLPMAIKIGPYFSALAAFARELTLAGADGLVLFNRFFQPDIDLEELETCSNLQLSTPNEVRVRLRWIAILRGRIQASLAATGGVHEWDDATKLLLAGADVVMLCSVLLKRGIPHLTEIRNGLTRWLVEREYESVEQMKGSMSQLACENPTAFERASYIRALTGYHLPM